ncbi:hypothetical protein Q9252_14140 [Marinobacter salarius]|uniref:hypothetical protein n=1 Tax=Marinobacter salarius TaxID=1420917 RepID=UPI00273A7C33|nr:hypothetical protein [Marinobacter salarius]MDP4533285.1 hypothetical protein [Marinobacter salarius]
MNLQYKFNSQSDAFALYRGAFDYFESNSNKSLEEIIDKHQFQNGEIREVYHLVSTYSENKQWITYFDFDDEAGKISDRLDKVFTEYCAAVGVSVDASKNVQPADTATPKIDWPETIERLELERIEGKEQTFVFGLKSSDPNCSYKQLSKSQMVQCVEYWINQAELDFQDIKLDVWNLSCDGEEIANDLDHIRTRIFGYGGTEAYRITLRDTAIDRKNILVGIVEAIASDVLGNDQVLSPDYAGCQNRIELVSELGVPVTFSSSSNLPEGEKELISKSLYSSFLGKFIREMYSQLADSEVVVFWKPDSDNDEYDDFEESLECADQDQELCSLTELLKNSDIGLSAVKANKILVEKGVLEELKKRGSKATKKIFSGKSPYGINVRKSDRKNDFEARYFKEPFQHLVDTYLTT